MGANEFLDGFKATINIALNKHLGWEFRVYFAIP